jgi:type IV pilus biogenesis protein PilP
MSASLRVPAVIAVAVLVAVSVRLIGAPPMLDAPESVEAEAQAALRSIPSPSPDAAPTLLSRSPFAADRSAYARATPEVAPPPPAAEIRLVAIFMRDGAPHATLLVDGEEVTVAVGDVTPVGVVARIANDAVELEGGATTRIGMFD